jgi:uncharacterized protein RhaS with RHS repeats
MAVYDYRNRFYSPALGRFLQTDPLRFAASDINIYRYVRNGAANWTDPFGLDPASAAAIFWGGVRLAGVEEVVGGGPEDPVADIAVAATILGAAVWAGIDYFIDHSSSQNVNQAPSENVNESRANDGWRDPADSDYPAPTPPGDPAQSPGEDWEWRGNGEPGSSEGSWYNPDTDESLHPDLDHDEPKGPHWDWTDPDGNVYDLPPTEEGPCEE